MGLRCPKKAPTSALGVVRYGPTEAETKSLVFRRSLYVCSDIKAGELLTEQNLRIVRPGSGLSPEHLATVLGMRVKRDVVRGSALTWDLLK